MSQFGNLYSQYYDLLYQDKDYQAEEKYVSSLIQNYMPKAHSLLDLGCGTGKHAELFCDRGLFVHGVDLSLEMLNIAEKRRIGKENQLSFSHSSIQNLSLDKRFDVITSLFHVMSYQNSNQELIQALEVAKDHLVDDGILIFDFWYGPAVLTERPTTRIKRLENDLIKVTRLAEPILHPQINCVDVHYNIFIRDKFKNNIFVEKKELHQMRYLFDTELELICEQVGFQVLDKYEWMSNKSPSFNSWNVVWILKNSI
ncbi:class I SAM-dependent DNA methyltransferase [Acinetobacter johnsonii]|uniref:class I SAM-dependent DNA methyltransferase n=1 Tax=Acinetobacter johnsonii TaxID=40214 RepID=UPI002935CCA7|nr:class I SAM-dependent methyltransferase [Acinetobacter johnsonii]MDV2487621.1 class I SAM-dependent methyltransferase [Acinetobacter johnsonii]